MNKKVRARIRRQNNGSGVIEIQRAKYKHWFRLGTHEETDLEFLMAFEAGNIEWQRKVIEPPKLF